MKIVVKNVASAIFVVLNFSLLVLCTNSEHRLSSATYPIDYKIQLTTQMNSNPQFDGQVEIRIGVTTDTDEIILNASFLENIKINSFVVDTDKEILISEVNKSTSGKLVLRPESTLIPGKEYLLKISYVGSYQNKTRGMFKSIISDEGQILALATNFLPQFASFVFPCYDEPRFRARFTIEIRHPVGYHAISNTGSALETVDTDGMKITIFYATPMISIHTLGFAVVNYKSTCNENEPKICAYYDEQHTAADVDLVLETAKSAIVELNNYLEIELERSKLDILPVTLQNPYYTSGSDGISFNNHEYFYFNPATSGLVHKEAVIRHTIRQVAIMYFGNMLVPEWWNDVWLIQGLSVLFEYIVADKLYPEFDETNQFLSALYEYGFIDAAVKPNNSNSQTPESLVYSGNEYKSAGILHMFKNIVGEGLFKTGLHNILATRANLINSETFFGIFTQMSIQDGMIPSHYDLNVIMNTWLTQLGYPMVRTYRSYVPVTDLTIVQRDIINSYRQIFRTTNWWIPYKCVTQKDSASTWTKTAPSRWVENIEDEEVEHVFGIEFDMFTWMVCNMELSGFYYINYDSSNYRLLATQLYTDHTKISPLTRAQLLHAALFSARIEYSYSSLIFEICNYIHREDTYTPVYIFITQFKGFAFDIYGAAPYENITKFIARKIGPAYERVRPTQLNADIKSLTFNDAKLRRIIVDMACFSGYENCTQDMNELLVEAVSHNDVNQINQLLSTDELKYSILHYGMVMADENLFWRMIALSSESENFATVLAHVQDPELLNKIFTILITQNGEKINETEINLSAYSRAMILSQLTKYNLPALDKTFEFMIEKSIIIKEILGDESLEVVAHLAVATKTEERLLKLRQLVELYKTTVRTFAAEIYKTDDNVWRTKLLIKQFQDTLSEILDHIDDEEEGNGGSATISVSIILFFNVIVLVYQNIWMHYPLV